MVSAYLAVVRHMLTGSEVISCLPQPQLNFATVELVLMLRISVLYSSPKYMRIFIAISFLVSLGAGFALRNVQPMAVVGDVFTREPILLFMVHCCSWFPSAGDCYVLQTIFPVPVFLDLYLWYYTRGTFETHFEAINTQFLPNRCLSSLFCSTKSI